MIYDSGEEGLCIWESGIVMARYFALQVAESVRGQTIVELGAGTGVTGLALLKHTPVQKVIFTDYLTPILKLIRENIEL